MDLQEVEHEAKLGGKFVEELSTTSLTGLVYAAMGRFLGELGLHAAICAVLILAVLGSRAIIKRVRRKDHGLIIVPGDWRP